MSYQSICKGLYKKASNEQLKKLASLIGMRKKAEDRQPLAKPNAPVSDPANQKYLSIINGRADGNYPLSIFPGKTDTLFIATGTKPAGEIRPSSNTPLRVSADQQAAVHGGRSSRLKKGLAQLSRFKQSLTEEDLGKLQFLLNDVWSDDGARKKRVEDFVKDRINDDKRSWELLYNLFQPMKEDPKHSRKYWDMFRFQAQNKPASTNTMNS